MIKIWREYGKFYRIQTDETTIHQKLKRREGAELCAEGFNCKLWVYKIKYNTPRDAKRGYARLCKDSLKRDA
jgi:hypothetical protein